MGRQAYLNRLALGRSPYEAPDNATVDSSNHVRRVSNVHADTYMQEYDARGHPVNTDSRTLGKDLRRAKNDILSTMGIVVSREDRNAGIPNEQQKLNQIASENDFGLVITTLDQLFIFFGTWWTSSLTGRVQTYNHYVHSTLLNVIQTERDSTGILNFYFAGIPAWAMASGLAIACENPLKRVFVSLRDYAQYLAGESLGVRSLFGLLYTVAKNSVLALSLEFYMYSTLQSLSLVSPYTFPSLKLLLPFGEQSLLQLPTLPTDLSAYSLGTSLVGLLTSPGVLVFLYGYYLRPQLEERIYRLIRRRLPKPNVPDELSVRVAYEENLIEWVVPTLGRRSDEEVHRSKLTFYEDIKCEMGYFRKWVFSLFGLMSSKSADQQALQTLRDERIETLRSSIEMLQQEIDGAQLSIAPRDGPSDPPGTTPGPQTATAAPPPQEVPGSAFSDHDIPAAALNQVLTNENRMSQSPGEMSNDYFSETATAGLVGGLSTASNPHNQPSESQNGEAIAMDRQISRSNTLFSRPSSPETSPPSSPRVRASLIHQNSDIITMQLELLGNRNGASQTQAPDLAQLNALAGSDPSSLNRAPDAMDRRLIAEFLEALIMSQAQRQRMGLPPVLDAEDLSSITAGASSTTPQDLGLPGSRSQPATGDPEDDELPPLEPIEEGIDSEDDELPPLESIEGGLEGAVPNILPDGVEEPTDEQQPDDLVPVAVMNNNDDAQSDALVQPILPSSLLSGHSTNSSSQSHRVTLLSAYPVDSLASHLAAAISGILLAPLEALYLRSMTRSWIITHPSSTVQLSDIHPLGLWFGGRTWSDVSAYTCRLVLMRGMQVAMRAGIWGFLVGSTMRIGRNFCGWGKL